MHFLYRMEITTKGTIVHLFLYKGMSEKASGNLNVFRGKLALKVSMNFATFVSRAPCAVGVQTGGGPCRVCPRVYDCIV